MAPGNNAKNTSFEACNTNKLFVLFFEMREKKESSVIYYEQRFKNFYNFPAWFDRYYSELSERQLGSFVVVCVISHVIFERCFQLRRFGHVDARGKDFKFKFSESHDVPGHLLLRSFIAWTKRSFTNAFAIQTIRYYGEY